MEIEQATPEQFAAALPNVVMNQTPRTPRPESEMSFIDKKSAAITYFRYIGRRIADDAVAKLDLPGIVLPEKVLTNYSTVRITNRLAASGLNTAGRETDVDFKVIVDGDALFRFAKARGFEGTVAAFERDVLPQVTQAIWKSLETQSNTLGLRDNLDLEAGDSRCVQTLSEVKKNLEDATERAYLCALTFKSHAVAGPASTADTHERPPTNDAEKHLLALLLEAFTTSTGQSRRTVLKVDMVLENLCRENLELSLKGSFNQYSKASEYRAAYNDPVVKAAVEKIRAGANDWEPYEVVNERLALGLDRDSRSDIAAHAIGMKSTLKGTKLLDAHGNALMEKNIVGIDHPADPPWVFSLKYALTRVGDFRIFIENIIKKTEEDLEAARATKDEQWISRAHAAHTRAKEFDGYAHIGRVAMAFVHDLQNACQGIEQCITSEDVEKFDQRALAAAAKNLQKNLANLPVPVSDELTRAAGDFLKSPRETLASVLAALYHECEHEVREIQETLSPTITPALRATRIANRATLISTTRSSGANKSES